MIRVCKRDLLHYSKTYQCVNSASATDIVRFWTSRWIPTQCHISNKQPSSVLISAFAHLLSVQYMQSHLTIIMANQLKDLSTQCKRLSDPSVLPGSYQHISWFKLSSVLFFKVYWGEFAFLIVFILAMQYKSEQLSHCGPQNLVTN